MKKIKAFEFEVVVIPGPPRISCKFITISNDSITLFGNSVKEILEQCIFRFPEGIATKGVIFSGDNSIDAKKNLSEFMSLGLSCGYFKQLPFPKNEEDGE